MKECPKCKKGEMVEAVRKKWSPHFGYLAVYALIAAVFFAVYGAFSSKNGSENAMPIFVGLAPLVIVPLVIEFKRRKFVRGWKCSGCKFFKEENK